MPERLPYKYAVIRVVPRVDRDEFMNAGVIVFSPQRRFLDAKVRLSEPRLRALWPKSELGTIRKHLEAIAKICAGSADGGTIAKLSPSERFHWLTAPRSSMIQVSPVRVGLTDQPAAELERLTDEFVAQ